MTTALEKPIARTVTRSRNKVGANCRRGTIPPIYSPRLPNRTREPVKPFYPFSATVIIGAHETNNASSGTAIQVILQQR